MDNDNTLSPSPSPINIPLFEDPQLIEVAGPILANAFENRVYALLEETSDFRSFVGLKFFRDVVLAQAISMSSGKLLSALILNQMIKDGRLEVGKVENPNSEFPTSTIKKV